MLICSNSYKAQELILPDLPGVCLEKKANSTNVNSNSNSTTDTTTAEIFNYYMELYTKT
jgi:hypothetical protein